jgi:predicted XRE-type DNA-binding protein
MKSGKLIRTAPNAAAVIEGSGNVFEDLGFFKTEAAELKVKAELTRQIYHRIKALGLTQVDAAKRLRVSQPDVSRLMNARPTRYSVDKLLSLLNALDVDIDIVVRPRAVTRSRHLGVVRITEAAIAG